MHVLTILSGRAENSNQMFSTDLALPVICCWWYIFQMTIIAVLATRLCRPLPSRFWCREQAKGRIFKSARHLDTWSHKRTPTFPKDLTVQILRLGERHGYCCDCTDPDRVHSAPAWVSKLSHDMQTTAMRSTCWNYHLGFSIWRTCVSKKSHLLRLMDFDMLLRFRVK